MHSLAGEAVFDGLLGTKTAFLTRPKVRKWEKGPYFFFEDGTFFEKSTFSSAKLSKKMNKKKLLFSRVGEKVGVGVVAWETWKRSEIPRLIQIWSLLRRPLKRSYTPSFQRWSGWLLTQFAHPNTTYETHWARRWAYCYTEHFIPILGRPGTPAPDCIYSSFGEIELFHICGLILRRNWQ